MMKQRHLKIIQRDFLKIASWEERTRQWQRRYLTRHPRSKLQTTADSEKCKHCGSPLNIKDHGTWIGYHCPRCGQGGSRQKSKRVRYPIRQRQLVQQTPAPRIEDLRQSLGVQKSVVDIDPAFYDAPSMTFSFELSDVNLGLAPQTVYLRNPKTNVEIKFDKYKTDKDATDEDIYGWHYKSEDNKYHLLIIND